MNLKFWHRPTVTQVRVITRDRVKLRLHEWRSDPALTKAAGVILNNSDARLMLDVLNNEHPAHFVLAPGTSVDDRAVYQARCEGYTMALANLEAMAMHQEAQKELEPTFEREEIKQ